jgi:hypothetical protein
MQHSYYTAILLEQIKVNTIKRILPDSKIILVTPAWQLPGQVILIKRIFIYASWSNGLLTDIISYFFMNS